MAIKDRNIYFYTGTIQNWQPVFYDFPQTIDIVLKGMEYIVTNEDVKIYAFVIMKDHIHIVWEFGNSLLIDDILNRFRRYTGKAIMEFIRNIDEEYLNHFKSERLDRVHKIWKINPSNFHLINEAIVIQKIGYINDNPTKGDYEVVDCSENYLHSSAKAYLENRSNYSFLTLFDA